MKKAVIVLLILSLCVGLCACGEPQVIEKEVEKIVEVIPDKYEQFKDVVEALANEEYAKAHELITAMEPEPEVPPIKEVTITTENFLDYFEYKEFPENNTHPEKDSAGNLNAVWGISGYYLKDGFSLAKEEVNACSVEIGVKYNYLLFSRGKGITFDLENHTYTITGKATWTDKHDESRTGNPYQKEEGGPISYYVSFNGLTYLTNDKDSTCQIISDIELVSASGTLYFYE